MALTRNALRERGITEKEVLDYIMEEHGNTVESAKETAKETTEVAMNKTIDGLQKQIDDAPKPDPNDKDWKTEHDTLKTKYDTDVAAKQKEYDDYKSGVESKEILAKKRDAARKLLIDRNMKADVVDDFMLDKLDYDTLELDGDGIKNVEAYIKPYQDRYAKYFAKVETKPAKTAKLPKGTEGNVEPEPKSLAEALHDKYKGD